MTPEQSLWVTVRKNLPGDKMRIENLIGAGTPDVNVCFQGKEVWLELKINENGRYKIRKEQHVWGMLRARLGGGSVYLLGYRPDDGEIDVWKYPFEVIILNDKLKAPAVPAHFTSSIRTFYKVIQFIFT
jgi:hypothetical protein